MGKSPEHDCQNNRQDDEQEHDGSPKCRSCTAANVCLVDGIADGTGERREYEDENEDENEPANHPRQIDIPCHMFNHLPVSVSRSLRRSGTDTVPARSSERSIHPSERIPPICSVRYYKVKVLPDEPNRHLVDGPQIWVSLYIHRKNRQSIYTDA